MQDRYAGDIGDFGKFALLIELIRRALKSRMMENITFPRSILFATSNWQKNCLRSLIFP